MKKNVNLSFRIRFPFLNRSGKNRRGGRSREQRGGAPSPRLSDHALSPRGQVIRKGPSIIQEKRYERIKKRRKDSRKLSGEDRSGYLKPGDDFLAYLMPDAFPDYRIITDICARKTRDGRFH
ncbi:hypothetical protein TNIN_149141 [Trichonephila inaurata madagascariensis]|uniref:Uncharacterized protein n=1 Tax=Trichonephila inaurata madagascariensis TaxID=2747483 RepID=A0A8X6X780_9ARAC|nr:hypothetical protein TNIN_149141 [Trichonephila inaurata madagascariensis]